MAVPKRKTSKARRDKRRSNVWKLETPGIVTSPKCGAVRLPPRMCKECMPDESMLEGTHMVRCHNWEEADK